MIRFNVHHLHDADSVELARQVVDGLPHSRAIREPTDDTGWSGVRVFDEHSQRWVTSLRWVRGQARNMDQAVHQLIKGVGVSVSDAIPKEQYMRKLTEELGVDRPMFRPGWRSGRRRK